MKESVEKKVKNLNASKLKNHQKSYKKANINHQEHKNSIHKFTQQQLKKAMNENKRLKLEIKALKNNVTNLELQTINLKVDIQKNIQDFQTKAKEFQAKAQAEVQKIKNELSEKHKQDQIEIKQYSLQKFFETMIDPFINLKQAIDAGSNSTDKNVQAYTVGFKMFIDKIMQVFTTFGLKEINPSVGTMFNPKFHECLAVIENKPHEQIVEVKQRGYQLHDRLIKPALVTTGK